MKQSTGTPLFRNCPNADIFNGNLESDCRRCELYEDCIRKKVIKMSQKRHKLKVREGKIIIAFFSIVAVSFTIILHSISFAMENDVQVESEVEVREYSIVELEKIEIEDYASEGKSETVNKIEHFEEVKEEIQCEDTEEKVPEPTISAYEPGTVYYYNISSEDKLYIAKVLYKEARGEIYEGMVAVACTVLNRYYSGDARFERDSIYSVITQSGAYASIDDVTIDMVKEIPKLEQAVEDACLGWDPTRKMFAEGALFFYAPGELEGYQKEIREGIQVLQIGNHNFHNDFNE